MVLNRDRRFRLTVIRTGICLSSADRDAVHVGHSTVNAGPWRYHRREGSIKMRATREAAPSKVPATAKSEATVRGLVDAATKEQGYRGSVDVQLRPPRGDKDGRP